MWNRREVLALGGSLVLGSLARSAPVPEAEDVSLYLIENVDEKGGVRKRSLVRWRFVKGEAQPKEIVLTLDQRYFGHFGGHRLAQDRYLITHFGGVIDLKEKKVVSEEELGELLGVEGKDVIYRVNNTRRESGIFAFDLTTRKLRKLDSPGAWGLPGVPSPDRKASAEVDWSSELQLHTPDGKKETLGKGFGYGLSPLASPSGRGAPVLWVDCDRILSQTNNGKLVTVRRDKTVKPLVEIPNLELPISTPSLRRDPDGTIVYRCGSHDFAIDVPAAKATPYDWIALGHGFDCEEAQNPAYGHILRHERNEIGRLWCSWYRAATAPGCLAVPYGEVGSNLGYPKGVKVWLKSTGKWATLDLWVNDLVGWIRSPQTP
jgi:hypothetical protein